MRFKPRLSMFVRCGAVAGAVLMQAFHATPSAAQAGAAAPVATPAARDGSHDFDFEFGSWKMHLKRLVHPLSDSTQWVEYDGTSTVRTIWDGRANLGEIELDGAAGHIEGLSLRVYDPQAQQWSLSFANSRGGGLGSPAIGGFENGRGQFYDQETYAGRAIFVRLIFSNRTASSFEIDQAFSPDGGQTWETNWVSTFTRS